MCLFLYIPKHFCAEKCFINSKISCSVYFLTHRILQTRRLISLRSYPKNLTIYIVLLNTQKLIRACHGTLAWNEVVPERLYRVALRERQGLYLETLQRIFQYSMNINKKTLITLWCSYDSNVLYFLFYFINILMILDFSRREFLLPLL